MQDLAGTLKLIADELTRRLNLVTDHPLLTRATDGTFNLTRVYDKRRTLLLQALGHTTKAAQCLAEIKGA